MGSSLGLLQIKGACKSSDLHYKDATCQGAERPGLLAKRTWAKGDSIALETSSTVPKQGKQDRPAGGGQTQPRAHNTRQDCGDDAGPRAGWEVSPQAGIRSSNCQADPQQWGKTDTKPGIHPMGCNSASTGAIARLCLCRRSALLQCSSSNN